MDNFIDLMGNVTYTPKQIRKRLASIEQKTFSKRDEKVLNRVASGAALGKRNPKAEEATAMDDFALFMEGMEVLAAEIRSDNALLINTIQYEKAVERLSQVVLADGREAYTYEEPTGTFTWDEETEEQVEVIRTISVPAIEPVPLTIREKVYDEEGNLIGEQEVNNPAVVIDATERAMAQSIVDNASAEVVALYEQRLEA